MQFVSKSGEVLSLVEYSGPLDDHMYLLSEPLPPNAFFIQVDGYLETGSHYSRLFETMATPVEVLIDLLEDQSTLVGAPGESTQATFRVYNNGPDSSFSYSSSDESEYIESWSPETSDINSLYWVDVVVSFTVPSTALPGTTSTVTFTATSDTQPDNTNTYITYYLVVNTDEDMEPPTCSSEDKPDCSEYTWDDTCNRGIWVVNADVRDSGSGLDRVYSRPSEGLTVAPFTDGTTNDVSATYNTTCCVTKLDIIGVDKRGNVGYCKWDLGEVKAWLLEFVVESVGETWAELRWNISETRSDFLKYTITIDNFFNEDNLCTNLVCRLNVTFLQSCTLHTFDLTPYFSSSTGFTVGSKLTTAESTLGTVPGVPTNPSITYTTDTSTTLTWDPPISKECLDHYQVCYMMYGNTDYECVTTPTNNVTLSSLEACTLYHVNVYAVSSFGALGPELKLDTNTDDAAPGAPENLRITNQTSNWVALAWDDPLDRANCVDAWKITYGETDAPTTPPPTLLQERVKEEEEVGVGVVGLVRDDPIITSDNFATISPLRACTNMTFWVSGVSPSGKTGSTRITQTTMEETEPTPVSSVEAVSLNEEAMLVVWTPGSNEECVTHYHVCLTDIVDLHQDCVDTPTIEQTFNGLAACVNYDVTVTPVSPSGVFGDPAFDIANTGDLPASEPTDLRVSEVTAHTALITYGPPHTNPRCVTEFNTELLEMGRSTVFATTLTPPTTPSPHMEEMVSGLGACSSYEFRIRAVTSSGFKSVWADVDFETDEDTPSVPRSLSHLTLTDTSVQLRWFVPESNPWCASVYRVTWTSTTTGDSGTRDIPVPNHPPEVVENIDGLSVCSDYTFTVSALTTLGTEGPAATHDTTTAC